VTITSKKDLKQPATGRRRYLRWLLLALGLGMAGATGITATVIGAYYYVAPGLPPAETIRQIPLQIPLRIFSRDGLLIEEVGANGGVFLLHMRTFRSTLSMPLLPPRTVASSFTLVLTTRGFCAPGCYC